MVGCEEEEEGVQTHRGPRRLARWGGDKSNLGGGCRGIGWIKRPHRDLTDASELGIECFMGRGGKIFFRFFLL